MNKDAMKNEVGGLMQAKQDERKRERHFNASLLHRASLAL